MKNTSIRIVMENPTLEEVTNRLRQISLNDDLYIIYTGKICDRLTDGEFYEYSRALIVSEILPFDNLIALYIDDTDLMWDVEPIAPFTIELISPDVEPEPPIYLLNVDNVPDHIKEVIEDTSSHLFNISWEKPEARTRSELIDPMLEQRGWIDQYIQREYYFSSEIDGSKNRLDYALFLNLNPENPDQLVAIIEAKHDSLPPDHGLEQAKLYALRKQSNIRFVFATNGKEFIEFDRLTNTKSKALPLANFPTPTELEQRFAQGKYVEPIIARTKRIVPKAAIDTNNLEHVRVVIQSLLTPHTIQASLEFLAESIRYANQFGEGKWEVTVGQTGRFVRLNVGKIEVCALFYDQMHIILDNDTLSDQQRINVEKYALLEGPTVYKSVISSMWCDLLVDNWLHVKPLIWNSYLSLIEKAATTVKKRTIYYQKHSKGVMEYLRQHIDPTLPDPIY